MSRDLVLVDLAIFISREEFTAATAATPTQFDAVAQSSDSLRVVLRLFLQALKERHMMKMIAATTR